MTELSNDLPVELEQTPDDGLQHPLVHEGGGTDEVVTNEQGDDKATVQQPSGDEVPRAEQG